MRLSSLTFIEPAFRRYYGGTVAPCLKAQVRLDGNVPEADAVTDTVTSMLKNYRSDRKSCRTPACTG